MASEYTPNFNLDLYTDLDKPNLRDQYNAAITKIDNQLQNTNTNINVALTAAQAAEKQAGDNATAISAETDRAEKAEAALKDSITAIPTDQINANTEAINNLKTDVTSNSSNIESLNNGLTVVNSSITTLNDKFPVGSPNIADGSITAAKLDSSAISSIISGLEIHHFKAGVSAADNAGLIAPDGASFEGYYIPAFTMLVISNLTWGNIPEGSSWQSYLNATSTQFRLPSYVPRPTQNASLAGTWIMNYDNGNRSFTGVGINPAGYIGPNSGIASGHSAYSMGCLVVFMRAFGGSFAIDSGNAFSALKDANGAL